MKLLTSGDFHGDEELKEEVLDELEGGDYDLFLAIGDYGSPGFYEDLQERVPVQFLATTGNWDFDFEPPGNDEYERLFNYKEVVFDDYRVVLMGAIYPDDFMDKVRDFFEEVPPEKRIIATHYPPHMLGDLAENGNRAGFPEFRELIMREKPALWTCGHIHEDFGRFSLMNTTVLNTAAAESGKAWSVEMGEDGVEKAEEIVLKD